MSGRKPPKRAGDTAHAPLTILRIADLAGLVVDPNFVAGPLDQEDLREALLELIEWHCGRRPSTQQPQEVAA